MEKPAPKSLSRTLREAVNLENGVLIVALLIAGSLLWNTMGVLQRNFQLQQEVDVMTQETELMQLETENLEFQKKYYQSPEFLELSARENLGLAAEGEKVIILPPQPEAIQRQAAQPTAQKEQSNFEQWLYFFFGGSASQS